MSAERHFLAPQDLLKILLYPSHYMPSDRMIPIPHLSSEISRYRIYQPHVSGAAVSEIRFVLVTIAVRVTETTSVVLMV